ncbi:MAG: hypothetical protein ABI823_14695 [Bryobacteraceae bacterium]
MTEFRDVILDACLHCYSYDVQFEGTRGSYMYELVERLPDKEFYFDQVLQSLRNDGDDWDVAQRFHFAACMASDNREGAKRAMYDAFDPGPKQGWHIAIEFLDLDGLKGLIFAAEKLGHLLVVGSDEIDPGWLLSRSFEAFGEQPTWDALVEVGQGNPAVEAFRIFAWNRHQAEADAGGQCRPAGASMTYEELLSQPSNRPFVYRNWGEKASVAELERSARGLMAATDSKQQFVHLQIFAERQFPFGAGPILQLTGCEENRVDFAAVRALKHLVDPAVRAFALRMMETGANRRGEAIDLIAKNFEPGDHAIALKWFVTEEDPYHRHSLGMDLVDFWKSHPDPETEIPMLNALYEKGPCSFCRERAVRNLLERNALTDELRAECAWDANDEIRELVAQTTPVVRTETREKRVSE